MTATPTMLGRKILSRMDGKIKYFGFRHNSGSQSRIGAVLLLAGLAFMIFSNVHVVHAATTEPVTVYSQTSGGSAISGMYVVLEQSGGYITSGFTPITWWLNVGASYQILADSYGQYSFSQWSTGDTSNPTTVVGSNAATSLAATYSSSGSGGSGGGSSITVNAQYDGSSLSGMYVALEQGGTVIGSGFTPITFSLVTGDSYQILADNYGQYAFSQWSDGNTADPDTITAAGSMTLTASYGGSAPMPQALSASSGLGIVIPLYAYPNSVWQSVINYHEEYPSVPMKVVINPSGGPGSYDSTIASWVSTLQGDGITVLGYVSTGYTLFPLSQVESQINDYVSWYNIHGIFIDDMENVPGYEWYYADVYSYAASDGVSFVLGNPGTSVSSGYIGLFTNIGTYENSGAPSLSLIASYTYGLPPSGWSFIAYNAGLPSQSYFDSMARYVSWVYVTDQPNSWTSLPSYMSQEMAEIAAA